MTVGPASYWSFRSAFEDAAEDDLIEYARRLLAPHREEWEWDRAGMWVRLVPVGAAMRTQGWKIHISATSGTADAVLRAVMPVLLDARVPFKFAANRTWVTWLNNANTPRESAGKFVTIYPVDDAQAIQLAQACDQATEQLAGPVILSDRPVRCGSLVHYRYGGFQPAAFYNEDGELLDAIQDLDGNLVPDERRPWFTPAAWAVNPFVASGPAGGSVGGRPATEKPAKAVLLDGRYLVEAVLKHANKGGVYRAADRETGDTVVVKEARPHVDASAPHADVISVLRHEARMLGLLESLGLAPRLLAVFEQQGHVFLVLEHFDGEVLRDYIGRPLNGFAGRPMSPDALRTMIRRLAEIVAAVHSAGLLLRDFTPNNVMVLPDGGLRLVDLELAHAFEDGPPPTATNGTPGFSAPGQMAGRPSGRPDDYYSLGAMAAFVATGVAPPMIADHGHDSRPFSAQVRDWFVGAEIDGLVPAGICDIVLGCMADDPDQRWSPRQVLAALRCPPHPYAHEPALVSSSDLTRTVGDIGRWLRRTVNEPGGFLWPTNCIGLRMDPCNVQSGASGVGLFLCRAGRVDPTLRDLTERAARWVSETLRTGPSRPPGLYFGLCGSAWFLAEAANLLDDPGLLDRASELALSVPTSSYNSDVTHGTAGIGLTQLHQWRLTGDARFLERADVAAKALVAAARTGPDGVVWPVPADVRSAFAGRAYYGYAHGSAGIAYYLLCAAAALDETGYRDLAVDGMETLVRVARGDGDTANWDSTTEQPYGWAHWCNGGAGVGAAFVRAYVVTGDLRYRRLAESAAAAVLQGAPRDSLVQCHGLAGGAELLLDLYGVTGERQFQDQAWQLADVIYRQRVQDDGLIVFPDETRTELSACFNTGLAGIGAFLFRLLHGGARPLTTDQLLARTVPAGAL